MKPLQKFIAQYSHFLSGRAFVLLIGLVSFPILTRMLTVEQYGIMALVTTTMFFVVALAKAGLSEGIIRFYKDYSDEEESRTMFVSTVMVRGLIFSVLVALIYIVGFYFLSDVLEISEQYYLCFMIMVIYLLVRPLNISVQNLLRVNDKTIFFNVVTIIGKLLAVGGAIFLLLYIIGNFYGYFVGLVIAELIVSIILFSWFFKKYRINLSLASWPLAAKLAKFGIPLLFTELSYLLLSYADRFMIMAYQGEEAVGLYSVGYSLASYVSDMLMFSLMYAVVPIYVALYRQQGREATEDFLNKCLHYVMLAVIPIAVGYYVISYNLFVVLASEKYAVAADFSPIILLGGLILGVNSILNAGLYLKKKTVMILLIMLSAVVINILLNIYLIPLYGPSGAAYATLVSCVVVVLLTIIASYRYITVTIQPLSLIYYLSLSGLMFVIITQISLQILWVDMLAKVVVAGAVIALGVLLKERELRGKLKDRFS